MYKVLIAEDEDIIRKGLVYSINWADLNCNIVADVTNGVEGVDAIMMHSPDIVIADIDMPVKTGLEMIQETCERFDYSSIIISGYSTFEFAQRAIELGVTGFLTKPLDTAEIIESVTKAKKEFDLRQMIKMNHVDRHRLKEIDLFDDIDSNKNSSHIVEQMLHFIYTNYCRKIIMRDLTRELNYSETFLNRKFKEAVGTTFNEYLNRYRIQKAVELLVEEPSISVKEVAWKCGIMDYKYFGNVFKKHIGCSPKEYINKIL